MAAILQGGTNFNADGSLYIQINVFLDKLDNFSFNDGHCVAPPLMRCRGCEIKIAFLLPVNPSSNAVK